MDITGRNICKSFHHKPVIKNVSISIPSGEIICLLGPSGAGKTTLIRLLIGAIPTDEGEIRYGQTLIPNLALLKKIGFMPQNDAIYEDLSGTGNLSFFAELYGMRKKDYMGRIDEVLRLVDLKEDSGKPVREYSGGMKKRLSLAAALLHEPEVLLLDEPTVGIDPVLRKAIWVQLKKLKEQGKTIIVSTHVMDEVTECDKAALIYQGQLIQYDTVSNLLSLTKSNKIEELFFLAADKKGGDAAC
ncbi:ABC transporter ATP-binding protein [Anaerocolumna xylanovorans]|uniref:ABC-2 type transport system ATP-binding protein n=1 Tax=Anaerocolumna xylanovorans DSM 12503 TaxID=1121345 RepID=A0A1M7YMK2_9FIRM|nr:ABC transporter ATP-binding protein [Anaerocolumna xylanovorans]SHO53807.1 ABC-2 type transport system ATP-binding protein [Anaerocolumna xylanovorans DSM 12503]